MTSEKNGTIDSTYINNIGDHVKIKKINKDSTSRMEDYFYLKKYENKQGTIIERNKCKSGNYAYRVEFETDNTGYFYEEDFVKLTDS